MKLGSFLENALNECLTMLEKHRNSTNENPYIFHVQDQEKLMFDRALFDRTLKRLKEHDCMFEFLESPQLKKMLRDQQLDAYMLERLVASLDTKETIQKFLSVPEYVIEALEKFAFSKNVRKTFEKSLSREKYFYFPANLYQYLRTEHSTNSHIQDLIRIHEYLLQYTEEEQKILQQLCLKTVYNLNLLNVLVNSGKQGYIEFEELKKMLEKNSSDAARTKYTFNI